MTRFESFEPLLFYTMILFLFVPPLLFFSQLFFCLCNQYYFQHWYYFCLWNRYNFLNCYYVGAHIIFCLRIEWWCMTTRSCRHKAIQRSRAQAIIAASSDVNPWWGRIVSAEVILCFCDGRRPAYSAVPKSGRMVSVRRSHRARTERVRKTPGVTWRLSKAREDGVHGVG